MAKSVVFIDAEIGVEDKKIHDLGAVRNNRTYFHSASLEISSGLFSEWNLFAVIISFTMI